MSRSTGSVRERTAAAGQRAQSAAVAAAESVPRVCTRTVRLAATIAALSGLGSLTATRIALNASITLPSVAYGTWFDAVATAAVVGPAVGVLLFGLTADEVWPQIGAVVAGVFGLLSTVSSTVAVPAVGATVVGGWLTLPGPNGVDWASNRRQARAGVVAVVLLAGLTLSLFGAVGVSPAALRPAGTTLTLAGMAVTPLAFRPRAGTLAAGGVAAGATLHLTGAAPFVSGAVALTAGSAVGASAPMLAAAVGGLIASVVDGATRRDIAPAATGLLLLTAGVASSIPRALSTVFAVAFVTATISDQREESR